MIGEQLDTTLHGRPRHKLAVAGKLKRTSGKTTGDTVTIDLSGRLGKSA